MCTSAAKENAHSDSGSQRWLSRDRNLPSAARRRFPVKAEWSDVDFRKNNHERATRLTAQSHPQEHHQTLYQADDCETGE